MVAGNFRFSQRFGFHEAANTKIEARLFLYPLFNDADLKKKQPKKRSLNYKCRKKVVYLFASKAL